jgi:hypothetical protein
VYEYKIEVLSANGKNWNLWLNLGLLESDDEARDAYAREKEIYGSGLLSDNDKVRIVKAKPQVWEEVDLSA